MSQLDGGGVEKLAALLLRRRYPDARQVNPTQGDGGVDIVRDTPDGAAVWQIKRFASPLTSSQKRQVKRSWKTFCRSHLEPGVPVASYTLVTVWTPTEDALKWWRSEVVGDRPFAVSWDGGLFFDELDADHPEVADRFIRGDDALERMVTAKAVLAASPAESPSPGTMLEALARRESALAAIRDVVSPSYHIDIAVMTTGAADKPPRHLRPDALQHRLTYLDHGRWQVESLVPRDAQSVEDDPISLGLRVDVEPGTEAAEQLLHWRAWGIPLRDFRAEVRQTGGPFGSTDWVDSAVTIGDMDGDQPAPEGLPDLVFRGPSGRHQVRFVVTDATRGVEGRGVRIVAKSEVGLLTLELRLWATLAPDSFFLRLNECAGLDPTTVTQELATMTFVAEAGGFEIGVQDGSTLVRGSELVSPDHAEHVAAIARALVTLQRHTEQVLVMPDFGRLTLRQGADLISYAGALDGDAIFTTWSEVVFTVADPAELARHWDGRRGGYLVTRFYPLLECGDFRIRVDTEFARTVLMPPPPENLADRSPGSEVVFQPGEDNTMTIAVIRDPDVEPLPPSAGEPGAGTTNQSTSGR